jgi:drug/metabolite transporter (DMT)-like permease
MSSRGVLRCAIAAVLFGISAPAASELAGDIGAFTLAGLLYVGAAIAMVPTLHRAPMSVASLRRGGRRLTIAVVLGGAVGPLLLMAGLGHVSAATASLLLNLELVFTIFVAALVFGEHVGRRIALGAALVVLAGVVLGWSGTAELRWGALLIGAACFCWAIDNSVTAALDELAPAHITLAKGIVAGGANLAIGLAIDGAPPLGPAVVALFVGAFGYGISITLWVAGARDLGAARGQLVFATAPFVGAVVAWTVLGDAASTREVASLLIAASGVALVLRSDHEHDHHHATVVHDHEHTHDDGHHDHIHEHDDRRPVGNDSLAAAGSASSRHRHTHHHTEIVHRHPHVPDLHHRHEHGS